MEKAKRKDVFLSLEDSLLLLFLLTDSSMIDQEAIIEYFLRQNINIGPTIKTALQKKSMKIIKQNGITYLKIV